MADKVNDDDAVILDYDTTQTHRQIPMFWMNIQPPTSIPFSVQL
jgi:hypothetical protein